MDWLMGLSRNAETNHIPTIPEEYDLPAVAQPLEVHGVAFHRHFFGASDRDRPPRLGLVRLMPML